MKKQATIYKFISIFIIVMLLSFMCINISMYKTKAATITISVSPTTKIMYVGKTYTLKANIKNTNTKPTWTSSNKSVATVNNVGRVTAKKYGVAYITAKVGNKSAKCKILVYDYVKSIRLNKTNAVIYTKDRLTLKATVSPQTAYKKKVTWKSSNNEIATVSKTGVVMPKRRGTIYIYAYSQDEKKVSAKCRVTIRQAVNSIYVPTKEYDLYTGKKYNVGAKVEPSYSYNKNIEYFSSNKKVATVDAKGNVIPVSVGTTTITCIAKDKKGAKTTVRINVRQSVEKIIINKTLYYTGTDVITTLKPEIYPHNAYNKKLLYESDNSVVATVDEKGNVNALTEGNVNITIRSTDGSNVYVVCRFTIKKSAKKITVPEEVKIPINYKSKAMSYSVEPTDACKEKIYWYSENPEIASVDKETGKVSLHKYGTTYIYCFNDNGTNLYSNKCKITVYKKKVTSLSISKSKYSIYEKRSFKLNAVAYPKDATDRKIKWKSSNKKVATVNDSGKVTTINKGSCIITAYTVDGSKISKYCKLNVKRYVSKVSITSKVRLNVGQKKKITVNIYPKSASNKKTIYKIKNKNIISYNPKTKQIYGKHKGKTILSIYSTDGSKKSDRCYVTVVQKVTKVNIKYKSVRIKVGSSLKLRAYVYPTNANNRKVKWTSSNNRIVSVSNKGIIKGKHRGNATVKATAIDGSKKSDRCYVTVIQKVTKVNIKYKSAKIRVGSSVKLKAYVYPTNANNRKVKWTSSNDRIVSVSNNGIIKGKFKGNATVKAISTDGSKKSDKCYVTVVQPVTSIKMNYKNIVMYKSSSVKLTATALPYTANDRKIYWSSSDKTVASVSKGNVYAHSGGSCYIYAKAGYNKKTVACKISVRKTDGKKISGDSFYYVTGQKEGLYNGKIIKLSHSAKNIIAKFIINKIGNISDNTAYSLTAQSVHDLMIDKKIGGSDTNKLVSILNQVYPDTLSKPTYDSISSDSKRNVNSAISFIFEHGGIAAKHQIRYVISGKEKHSPIMDKYSCILNYSISGNIMRYYN